MGDSREIPLTALLRALDGIAVAAKVTNEAVGLLQQWATAAIGAASHQKKVTASLSVRQWLDSAASQVSLSDAHLTGLAGLAVAVASLREDGQGSSVDNAAATIANRNLDRIWHLVHEAVIAPTQEHFTFTASRSAQGFLAVPLCSLLKDGRIDELIRLHVWLPDGQRGNNDFAIHAHQPFAQSWILAGKGEDHSYKVERTDDAAKATHTEYELSWNDGKSFDRAYKTHQNESVIVNTGRLVRAEDVLAITHSRNTSYVIPSASFHRSVVPPDTFHATLFMFDASRGYTQDAYVLGPPSGRSWVQSRSPAGATPAALAGAVEAVRSWEQTMGQGQQYAECSDLEHALRAYRDALNICNTSPHLPRAEHYRKLVLGEMAGAYRRFGQYERAAEILEGMVNEMSLSAERLGLIGELGVVYRHMNRLRDAQATFELQYNTAKQLGNEVEIGRAIGNLGMVNYQLFRQTGDTTLLKLAIEQLHERVNISRRLKLAIRSSTADQKSRDRLLQQAIIRESIGLSRLSLCYTSLGDNAMAVKLSRESLENALQANDKTAVAYSQFFYGRSLVFAGRSAEALPVFNPVNACTPMMAFCKEPSDEHREYLQELTQNGARPDMVDGEGYTALDYAVYSGDAATISIVLESLRHVLDGPDVEAQLKQRRYESDLRKHYRELFQEKLRPNLLKRSDVGLRELRRAYAAALASNADARSMFDGLKFLRFCDFREFGRILRSSEPRAQQSLSESLEQDPVHGPINLMVFISYRWINRTPGATGPDDARNTQYQRILLAVTDLLRLYPHVDESNVGIWVDYTCVDQDHPMPGVQALPMIVAQCDVVISLVDDTYYTRAWCAVEVMMIRTLQQSYGIHRWYEQTRVPDTESHDGKQSKWALRDGPKDIEISMADKFLSVEEDRPKVMFLERQTKLLG